MKKRKHDFFLAFWIFIYAGLLYQDTEGRRCHTPNGITCCVHFYENSKKECRECDIGYTSKNGAKCHKCPKPFYGFHCAHMCSCNDDQICDHKIGCTIKRHIGSSGYGGDCPIGTFSDAGQTCKECPIGLYGKNCLEECICRDNKRCDNIHGCIESTFDTSGKGKDDINKVAFYAGGAGLLVVGIFIGMLFTGVKNKCCSRQQRASEQKGDERQLPAKGSIEMNTYEYVDEEQMTEQHHCTVPPSLPVPRKFEQHQCRKAFGNNYTDVLDGQNGIPIEDEGYLNPYQAIQQANIYQHEYRVIVANSTKNKQIDEYLNPYNSLVKHDKSEGHEYKDLKNANFKSELKNSCSNKFQSYV